MRKSFYSEFTPYRKNRRQADAFHLSPHARPRSRANVLTPRDIDQVETYILTTSRIPIATLLKFRLTIYAGLRVGEVLNIHLSDLAGHDGKPSEFVHVRPKVGKGGRERLVPMHPRIAELVIKFQLHHPDVDYVAFSQRWYTPKRQTLTALTNQFHWLYRKAGLSGFSSHSGRRTFITNLARNAGKNNCSLRDVQELAGHSRLETTQEYIEPSDNLGKLLRSLK